MTESRPSPLATPEAWNLVAPGYAEVNFDQFAKYAADALSLADVQPRDEVLDVATGPGSLSLQAARIARHVAALDFSPAMLEELRARMAQQGLTHIDVREGDGQALPYDDGSFDAAFSMFGLMFFPARDKGFAELYRVLRPGGRAVVASWQPMERAEIVDDIFGALAAELPNLPLGGAKAPLSDPNDFRREMSAAGFRVRLEERVHALEAPSFEVFWAGVRRSLAPLVLLENSMGAEAFAPVLTGMERRLRERHDGPVYAEMPAWLALGEKPS